MAVLLDTRDLAPAERNDAVRHVIEFSSGPSFVGHDCPAERISGLMEYWQLGNAHILRSSDVGLHLSRDARDLRKSAPEMLAVGIHLAGTGTFANADVRQLVTPGDLYLNDMTASYEYAYAGAGAAMAFVISYEQLGVPVDVARRANGRLAASPVYDLMTGHLARLCRTADELPDGPARAMLGTATIELMRALISSAAGDDPQQDAALNDALFTRVVIYVQEHLTDRDLLRREGRPGTPHLRPAPLQPVGRPRAEPGAVDHARAPGEGAARTGPAQETGRHGRDDRAPLGLRRSHALLPQVQRGLRHVTPGVAPAPPVTRAPARTPGLADPAHFGAAGAGLESRRSARHGR